MQVKKSSHKIPGELALCHNILYCHTRLSCDSGGCDGKEEEGEEVENATTTFVSLGTTNPNGTGSRSGVVFYNTNSTGQLAFLDNMIGIYQAESSHDRAIVRVWE